MSFFFCKSKGQIKLKEDCRAVDSPKERTNEFVVFAFHSKQNKLVRLFFAKKTLKLKTLQPMFLYLKDFPQELCDSDMMKLLQFRKMCDVHFHMQPSLDETYATVPCLLSCVRNP